MRRSRLATYLPQRDTCVGILDGRQAAVRVELHVRLAFGIRKLERFPVVRQIHFLEDDADFPELELASDPFDRASSRTMGLALPSGPRP